MEAIKQALTEALTWEAFLLLISQALLLSLLLTALFLLFLNIVKPLNSIPGQKRVINRALKQQASLKYEHKKRQAALRYLTTQGQPIDHLLADEAEDTNVQTT